MGREGSRKIQLAVAALSLLVHTVMLTMVIAGLDLGPGPYGTRDPALIQNTAIFSLCLGWISFPVFIFQIFLMKD